VRTRSRRAATSGLIIYRVDDFAEGYDGNPYLCPCCCRVACARIRCGCGVNAPGLPKAWVQVQM